MSDDPSFPDDLRRLGPQRVQQFRDFLLMLTALPDDQQDAALDALSAYAERLSPQALGRALDHLREGSPLAEPHTFTFEDQYEVRLIQRGEESWFVALDVCSALEIGNSSQAISRLDDDERDEVITSDPIGRQQRTAIISESGLYALILTSRKPQARAFKRWITHDVLPSIRRTGRYDARTLTPAEQLLAAARQLVDHERALADHEQRLNDIEHRQTAIEQGSRYFTIVAYASRRGLRVDNHQARVFGHAAASYSREHGYPIGQAPDARYGTVNTYHEEVLQAVFGEARRALPDPHHRS